MACPEDLPEDDLPPEETEEEPDEDTEEEAPEGVKPEEADAWDHLSFRRGGW